MHCERDERRNGCPDRYQHGAEAHDPGIDQVYWKQQTF
jgi:hypothetical protein